MKRIVYYISDHGYGHATRGIGLIRELAKNTDLQIIIKTGRPLSFIKQSLAGFSNIKYIYSQNDVGLILEKDSLEVDQQALYKAVMDWVDNWDELVPAEVSFLKENQLDLVISDITPWPFIAAEKAGVKSIAISNFTWYEIYKDLFGFHSFIEMIGDAYTKADKFLRLPLSLNIENANNTEEIGFIARKINKEKASEYRERIGREKKLIYVGLGKSVDFNVLAKIDFQKYRDYNFLFSAGAPLKGNNIYIIPEEITEIQNYIAACDYVITKAGWSTVAEAILGGVPLLLIKRDGIIEDKTIRNKVERLGLGLSITIDEFFNLDIFGNLAELDMLYKNFSKYENNTEKVAGKILNIIN